MPILRPPQAPLGLPRLRAPAELRLGLDSFLGTGGLPVLGLLERSLPDRVKDFVVPRPFGARGVCLQYCRAASTPRRFEPEPNIFVASRRAVRTALQNFS